MKATERGQFLDAMGLDQHDDLARKLGKRERRTLPHAWELHAHAGQLPPPGDWQTWLILAGRGFGKTRAGAEWVRAAAGDPQARIALVGASLGEARAVMVEGESGLIAIAPRGNRPRFEPSKRQLTWPNGAMATLYSAAEPESLRGPQHSHACRPGPEGSLHQRKPCPTGHVGAPGNRRNGERPARRPKRWSDVDCGRPARRCVGRKECQHRGLDRRTVAVRFPARRTARFQPGRKAFTGLQGRLGFAAARGIARRRHCRRQRSTRSHRRIAQFAIPGRDFACKLMDRAMQQCRKVAISRH